MMLRLHDERRRTGTVWESLLLLSWVAMTALLGGCGDDSAKAKAIDVSAEPRPGWTDVSRGNGHTLAVAADGSLWAWGDNASGQLGIGTAGGQQNVPKQVGSSHQWSRVAAGDQFSLALRIDGTLWSWGANLKGQLGRGIPPTGFNTPGQVGSSKAWRQIITGGNAVGPYQFALAIRDNGTLWSWGDNTFGQLGLGTVGGQQNTPSQVPGLWTQVAAGVDFVTGLQTDGDIWTFGNNSFCTLGRGLPCTGSQPTPTSLNTLTHWAKVVAARTHAVAMQATPGIPGYSLYGWGSDAQGQIIGATTDPQPLPVSLVVQCMDIGVGDDFTMCIDTAGSMLVAGNNANGAWGDGTFGGGPSTSFLPAGGGTNWVKVVAGGLTPTAAAYQSDGTLWLWGFGNSGAIGDGFATSYASPTKLE